MSERLHGGKRNWFNKHKNDVEYILVAEKRIYDSQSSCFFVATTLNCHIKNEKIHSKNYYKIIEVKINKHISTK